eukprot:scaffold83594_cov18-Tisochrysis_lutea.AAC.1
MPSWQKSTSCMCVCKPARHEGASNILTYALHVPSLKPVPLCAAGPGAQCHHGAQQAQVCACAAAAADLAAP